MTPRERDEKISKLMAKDRAVLIQKGHDYSGEDDSMSNLRDFGFMGVIVRIGDKYNRLKNFVASGKLKVASETILDTLSDLRNYAYLAELLYEEEMPSTIDSSMLEKETDLSIDRVRCAICGLPLKEGELGAMDKNGNIFHLICAEKKAEEINVD